MDYRILLQEENDAVRERYQLSMERIRSMETEEMRLPYGSYFKKTAAFIDQIGKLVEGRMQGGRDSMSLEQLQAAGFPFLALGRSQLPQPYAWFDFDNYAGTYQATRWLIEKGHQRIALLGESNNQAFITQRRQGYLDALREAGLSSEWLRAMPPSRRVGYATTKELLSLPQPPTAIITDCNTHGDGAAMALAQLGRLTGENAVSLVVYDGLPQDSIVDIDVAAVIQSTRQGVGKQIADMVRQLINGDDIDTLQVLWQPEFSPGQTA